MKHDMLSKQTDPAVLDSVAIDAKENGKKSDGHEIATITTSQGQVVVNVTTDTFDQDVVNVTMDTTDSVGQDVSFANVLDHIDNHTPLIQETGYGNLSYHVDHYDTIPDPVSQSTESLIAPINEATDDAGDAQQAHGQQADVAPHIVGLDVHIPRSSLPYRRDSDAH